MDGRLFHKILLRQQLQLLRLTDIQFTVRKNCRISELVQLEIRSQRVSFKHVSVPLKVVRNPVITGNGIISLAQHLNGFLMIRMLTHQFKQRFVYDGIILLPEFFDFAAGYDDYFGDRSEIRRRLNL